MKSEWVHGYSISQSEVIDILEPTKSDTSSSTSSIKVLESHMKHLISNRANTDSHTTRIRSQTFAFANYNQLALEPVILSASRSEEPPSRFREQRKWRGGVSRVSNKTHEWPRSEWRNAPFSTDSQGFLSTVPPPPPFLLVAKSDFAKGPANH